MLKIKLSPRGKKHQVTYRIVVMEARSKLNGRFTDDLGFYNPITKEIKIDKSKLTSWLNNGAQLTNGVGRLIDPDKFPAKKKKDRSKKAEEKAETKPDQVKIEN